MTEELEEAITDALGIADVITADLGEDPTRELAEDLIDMFCDCAKRLRAALKNDDRRKTADRLNDKLSAAMIEIERLAEDLGPGNRLKLAVAGVDLTDVHGALDDLVQYPDG